MLGESNSSALREARSFTFSAGSNRIAAMLHTTTYPQQDSNLRHLSKSQELMPSQLWKRVAVLSSQVANLQ